MRSRGRARLAVWAMLSAVTGAGPAGAQTGAAALFASGDTALAARRFEVALRDCGAAASALQNGPRERLGRAQVCAAQAARGLGRTASAVEFATQAIQNIEASGTTVPRYQADLRTARWMVRELAARVGRVTVTVEPANVSDQVRVSVNGARIEASRLGTPVVCDPGAVTVEVAAEGYRTERTEVTVGPGEERVATVRLAVIAPESPPPVRASSIADAFASGRLGVEFGVEGGYLGFLGYRGYGGPPAWSREFNASEVLTSEGSPAVGLGASLLVRVSRALHAELLLRGGLRTAEGAGWYLLGGVGLALFLDGGIGMSVAALVGSATFDVTLDYYNFTAVRNDLHSFPVHRGTAVGGEVAVRFLVTSWHRGGLTLSLRATALKAVTEPGVVLAVPLMLGLRFW